MIPALPKVMETIKNSMISIFTESTRIVFSVMILLLASLLVTQPERAIKRTESSQTQAKNLKPSKSLRLPSSRTH